MSSDQKRSVPQSDLDLNLMLTNAVWGSPEVSQELRVRLAQKFDLKDTESGKEIELKASAWGMLGFYTRDMRLGNLSDLNGELSVCRYYIDLANDLLTCGMTKPFLIALSRSATILETSQSKKGFLRNILNTLRQEHTSTTIEPPKKKIFGGKRDR